MFLLGVLSIVVTGGIVTIAIIHKINDSSRVIFETSFKAEKGICNAVSKIERELRDNVQSVQEKNIQFIKSLETTINNDYQKLVEEFEALDKWDESCLQFIRDNKSLVQESLEGISVLEEQIRELGLSLSNNVDSLSEEAQKMLVEQQIFEKLLKEYPSQLINSISNLENYFKVQNQQQGNIVVKKLEVIIEKLETVKRASQTNKQELTELLGASVDPIINCLKEIIKETTKSREDHENFASLINKGHDSFLDFSKYSQGKALAIQALLQEIQDNSLRTTELNKCLQKEKEDLQNILETSLGTIQKDIDASTRGITHIENNVPQIEKELQNVSTIITNISTQKAKEEPQDVIGNQSEDNDSEPINGKENTFQNGIDTSPSERISGVSSPVAIQPSYIRDPLPDEGQQVDGKEVKSDPRKRGGRRPGSKGTPNGEGDKRIFPEMYCIKRVGHWEVILKLPKQILKQVHKHQADITINNEPARFNSRKGECLINQMKTECIVTSDVYTSSYKKFGDGEYLLFKLRKRGAGDARFIEKYSEGVYLCIVPEDFSIDKGRSCAEWITPERVSIPGHLVHFFNPSPEKGIVFHKPKGEILEIPTYFEKFSLEGKKLAFVVEENFFISELPTIVATVSSYWKQVDKIELRHEMPGEKRLKEFINLTCEGARRRIILPESMETRGGYFTVLLYNKWNELIESHPFYFHQDIASIETLEYDPYAEKVSSEISMKITHASGMVFTPSDEVTSQNVEYETSQGETSIVFPQCPEIQTFRWKIEQEGSDTVFFSFDFPGFYWSIGNWQNPGQWSKEQLELSLKDLKAVAGKVLYTRAPMDVYKFRAIFQHSSEAAWKKLYFDSETGFWKINISELGHKIVSEQKRYSYRRIPLVISFYNQTGFHQRRIGNFIERQICKYCRKRVPADQLKQHFTENHREEILKENYRELTYDELAAVDKSLPKAIYKCSYCPFYSQTGVYENPTDVICKHIKEKHPGKTTSFTSVHDLTEIRENVLTHLCETWRCKICAKDFTDQEKMLRHLFNEHLNSLIDDTKEA